MLQQVTMPWGATCVVTRGNASLSLLYASAAVIAQRWERGQRTRITYIGDWDAAGMDMSDHLHERLVEVGAPAPSVDVRRVALTEELIVAHQLPPHEPKHKDSRTPAFIARYGVACVEVDALPPTVLVEVVEEAIRGCVEDPAAWEAGQEQEAWDMHVLQCCARNDGPSLDGWAARLASEGE